MSTTRKNATSARDQSLNRMPGRPVTSPSRRDTASATGTATRSSSHPVLVEDGGGVGAAGEHRHLTEGKLTAVAEADVEAGDHHGVDRGEQDLTFPVRPDQAERRQGGHDRGDEQRKDPSEPAEQRCPTGHHTVLRFRTPNRPAGRATSTTTRTAKIRIGTQSTLR